MRSDGSCSDCIIFLSDSQSIKGKVILSQSLNETHLKLSTVLKKSAGLNCNLLIESVKDYAIMMLDPTGHVIEWNTGAEAIYGYSPKMIHGMHIAKFFTEQACDRQEPEIELKTARQVGKFEGDGWRVRSDGGLFWASVLLTAIHDNEGVLIGYGKFTRDLTAKKRQDEETLQINEELQSELHKSRLELTDYKHALDESSILAITDHRGKIQYANDNFCRISKFQREELIGKDHRIINSGNHARDFMRDLWSTISAGKIWHGEIKNKAKDGSHYWVNTTIVPFVDQLGKPYQYLAIRNDITSRKLAEEELLKSKEELELRVKERTLELTQALERERELNEMKSRFISMASHEFRTPLSAILSSMSLIEHYTAPGQEEKRGKHLERIRSSVGNLTSILDDFLSLEKLEQGKVEIYPTRFQVKDVINKVIDMMDVAIRKKSIVVAFYLTGSQWMSTDRKILENVLINLLSNAIKYSGEEGKIEILAQTCNDTTFISVRDNGIGIPYAAQEHLFDKFYRASNAMNIQGTGLGLNIVKRYAELLDGSIAFSSVENEGSIFSLEIPTVLKSGTRNEPRT
ncbi:MAG: PAS domain-containing sensor histidine kinase [Chitinophagaceae bacterium]|nr:MAG: PAS domain-containing sensor histidine kinase [Chitinophagaceae bacterium]